MKNVTQMREEIKLCIEQLSDMKQRCTQEKRESNEEERIRAAEILDRIDILEAQIALEERTESTMERLNKPATESIKPNPEIRDKAERERRKKDSFLSFGEQIQAVIRAGQPDGYVDQRLTTRAATGLNESIPSDGGFLVQKEYASGLMENVWENGEVPRRIDKVTLSGNKNGMVFNGYDETNRANGSRAGGILMYWLDEAGSKTASKPKFRQIDLKLKKLIGLCYLTDELLEDVSALEQEVAKAFNKEMDFQITDSAIRGTGAGRPLGILNAGCLVTVNKETGQAAATLQFENVNNMWARMKADSWNNAVWHVNQDCLPQLNTMSVVVGTGGVPVYMPAGGASQNPYSALFGRPVIPLETCSTLGTKGDIFLCDWSNYKAIDKGGMKQDISIHVRYLYDESVLRFVYRYDGEPVLGSAITPYKGTNTLSHFITLQARA